MGRLLLESACGLCEQDDQKQQGALQMAQAINRWLVYLPAANPAYLPDVLCCTLLCLCLVFSPLPRLGSAPFCAALFYFVLLCSKPYRLPLFFSVMLCSATSLLCAALFYSATSLLCSVLLRSVLLLSVLL